MDATGLEPLAGKGLGEPLSETDADKALANITRAVPVENWAGEVLSANEAAARLDITRSAINNWRQKAQVLSWPTGLNEHQYPAEQFKDGRVLKGIADVIAIQPNGRVAWRWMRTPHVDFDGGTPLNALRHEIVEEVRDAALRRFG